MQEETLKRLLSLIEKTGDRLIVTDSAGEHPYVLMALEHYEKLTVGSWKPEVIRHEPHPPQALPVSNVEPDNKPPKREIPLWKAQNPAPVGPRLPQDRPRYEEQPPATSQKPVSSAPPSAPAPKPVQPPAAEILPEPEGEEQFYLEPLE